MNDPFRVNQIVVIVIGGGGRRSAFRIKRRLRGKSQRATIVCAVLTRQTVVFDDLNTIRGKLKTSKQITAFIPAFDAPSTDIHCSGIVDSPSTCTCACRPGRRS